MRTYLVIENYKIGKTVEIYQRFSEKGRMLSDGVKYVNSWIEEDLQKCYQIMESDNIEQLNIWIDNWKDLVDFEVIPVIHSAEAAQQVNRKKS